MHKTYGTTPLAITDNVKNNTININAVRLYPNPMRDHIHFIINQYGRDGSQTRLNVTIMVYDQTGEIVYQTVGARRVVPMQWFGENDAGQNVDPGMYFYRITTRENIFTGRIIKVE
jgi:flagellar hook assembly protein FlgD